MDELVKWPILNRLGHDFLSDITVAHVYDLGKSALICTVKGQVYQVHKCDVDGNSQLCAIDQLFGKGVRSFSTSSDHYLALTKDGTVYGWGRNEYGQLGDGTTEDRKTPCLLAGLSEYKFTQLCCGSQHTLALTSDGKVLAWGRDQEGQCAGKVAPETVLDQVKTIRASGHTSACLTKNGALYTWGENNYGKLGIGENDGEKIRSPHRVDVGGHSITDIHYGENHLLALTDTGRVLAVGKNSYGQLGNETGKSTSRPVTVVDVDDIDGKPAKYISIATHSASDTSAGLSLLGSVFVWGRWGDRGKTKHTKPVRTTLTTLDSVFALLENMSGTYTPIPVKHKRPDFAKALDNQQYADCKFLFGDKALYAHRQLLALRSDYFAAMFKNDWAESKGEIRIHNHSYHVYKALLRYLYTNELRIENERLLDLLELAQETLLTELVDKCTTKIRRELVPENVSSVFQVAVKLDLRELLDFCQVYSRFHVREVLSSDSFLGSNPLMKQFVTFLFQEKCDSPP